MQNIKIFYLSFQCILDKKIQTTVQMLISTLFAEDISGSFLSPFEIEVKEGDMK